MSYFDTLAFTDTHKLTSFSTPFKPITYIIIYSLIHAVDIYELILRYLLHNWGNTTRQQWQALKPHNIAILPFTNVECHLSHAWQLHLSCIHSQSVTFEDIIIRESGTDNLVKWNWMFNLGEYGTSTKTASRQLVLGKGDKKKIILTMGL